MLNVKKNSTFVKFTDIEKVIVFRGKDDTLKRVKISAPGGGLDLFGFKDLNVLISEIKDKIGSDKVGIKKTSSLGSNPLTLFGAMVVTVLLIAAIQKFGGKALYELSNALVMSVVGFVVLFLKPISKKGANQFRKLEVICGSGMFICGIMLTIFELLNK